MRVTRTSGQFERDLKLQQRRGKDMEKLRTIIRALAAGETLGAIHRDHSLAGSWKGRRECHIESDWLLIYKLEGSEIIFERTGSHADLFKL
jgi:mRNA interferase YafQ